MTNRHFTNDVSCIHSCHLRFDLPRLKHKKNTTIHGHWPGRPFCKSGKLGIAADGYTPSELWELLDLGGNGTVMQVPLSIVPRFGKLFFLLLCCFVVWWHLGKWIEFDRMRVIVIVLMPVSVIRGMDNNNNNNNNNNNKGSTEVRSTVQMFK